MKQNTILFKSNLFFFLAWRTFPPLSPPLPNQNSDMFKDVFHTHIRACTHKSQMNFLSLIPRVSSLKNLSVYVQLLTVIIRHTPGSDLWMCIILGFPWPPNYCSSVTLSSTYTFTKFGKEHVKISFFVEIVLWRARDRMFFTVGYQKTHNISF